MTSGDTYVAPVEMTRGLDLVQVETKMFETQLHFLISERQWRVGDIETLILNLGPTRS